MAAPLAAVTVVRRDGGHGPGGGGGGRHQGERRGRRAHWRRQLRTRRGQSDIFMVDGCVTAVRRRRAVPVGRGRTAGGPAGDAPGEADSASTVRPPRTVLLAAGRPQQRAAPRSVHLRILFHGISSVLWLSILMLWLSSLLF